VAAVHLGLGAFFRAHQAAYTALAPDAEAWGYAAFTGRSARLADALTAQDGLYSLLRRAASGDEVSVIGSVAEARAGSDVRRWLALAAAPETRLVTLTVTEAAYHRAADGALDLDSPGIAADLAALRRGAPEECRSIPGRLVAGLAARARAGGEALAIVPCDNLPDNGEAVRRVVIDLAAACGDAELVDWIGQRVSFVSTEVDRITPRTTPADVETVRRLTGLDDRCPVVTEPFSEWTLAGSFPGGRPRWEDAGAVFVDGVDGVAPYERRKLWLLNGAHSLLAYAGSSLGHETVASAIEDQRCRRWVEEWWDEACAGLSLPTDALTDYRAALLERFTNPGIRHLLAQIAMDGSQKLRVRIVPVVLASHAAGRSSTAAALVLGAWIAHLRGAGAPVSDPRADELTALAAGPPADAVPRLLEALDPRLLGDPQLVAATLENTTQITREQSR